MSIRVLAGRLVTVTALAFGSCTYEYDASWRCENGTRDGDEEGVDCGGSCVRERGGELAGTCCFDGALSAGEVGIDCGGTCLERFGLDCCANGAKDEGELGIDCGGDCQARLGTDCCSSGTKEDGESDVDCGGTCAALDATSDAGRCDIGKVCAADADCRLNVRCDSFPDGYRRCVAERLHGTWHKLAVSAPADLTPRYAARLAFGGPRGVLVSGYDGASINETWLFEPDPETPPVWSQRSGPLVHYTALAFDPVLGLYVAAGGWVTNASNNQATAKTWIRESDQWATDPLWNLPLPNASPTMVHDLAASELVMIGGDQMPVDEVWVRPSSADSWQTTPWEVRAVTGGPTHTAYHQASIYDAEHQRIVVFGGVRKPMQTLGSAETWLYDGAARTWTEWNEPGPSPRWGMGMGYDPRRLRGVLFGGRFGLEKDDAQQFNEVWEWTGEGWIQVDVVPGADGEPRPSFHVAFADDPVTKSMILFLGASGAYVERSETWAYTSLGWPCATNADCGMGATCADGVCCNDACEAGVCNDPLEAGICKTP